MLQKLSFYGINGKFLSWIKSFLEHRTQRVLFNKHLSYPTKVVSGVPQGSVLGPVLFIIYINDLPERIQFSKIFTFADDTKVVSEVSNSEDTFKLQQDLCQLIQWTKDNNMELNTKKFEFINHRLSGLNANLKLLKHLPFYNSYFFYNATEDIEISPSLFARDLGVMVDNKLNWDQHINFITTNSKKMCGWILSVFYTRDRYVLLLLFKSLVRSRLEYCSILWNPHLIRNIVKVENVQRYFTYKIQGMKKFNYWERIKLLKIHSLQRRRERAIILYLWKIKNNIVPNSFDIKFKDSKRNGGSKAIVKPLPKVKGRVLTIYDESFQIVSAKLWNVLPNKITLINSLSAFEFELDNFLKLIPDEPPLPGYPSRSNNSILNQSVENVG